MLKIVHIARPIAGVGVYISLTIKHLNKYKFSNVVICNTKENNIGLYDSLGNKTSIHHADLFRKINPIKDFLTFLQIIKILKIEKPDIIHCHSAKAGILGRLAGAYLNIKTFYTPHAYSYLSQDKSFKKGVFKFIERIMSKLPAITLACSESEFLKGKNELNIKKEKLKFWNNSIEDNINLSRYDLLKNLPKQYFCTIGRPSFQKNTELLIKSIIELKKNQREFHLVILGAGLFSPSLEKVKSLINDNNLNLNVTIIPWINRLEALKVLKKSMFYISTSRYEGLPYSLIEAISLNKACIVTNVGGNTDVITHKENGFVVNNNEKEIAKRIKELMNDEKLRDEMSKKAREIFLNKFCIKKNIYELENIYLS